MKRTLRTAAKRVLVAGAYRAIYLAGRGRYDGGVTVLAYHSIDDHDTDLSIPTKLFERQMAMLAAGGYRSLTMSQVGAYLQKGPPLPPRTVAITFDDGFASVVASAAPVMARYGFVGTDYVITGMVGRMTRWQTHGMALPPEPMATWPEIQSLCARGFEIGAHGVTHRFLTQCTPTELRRELIESRATLEDKLGTAVRAFSYPQGDYNSEVVRAALASGYTSAVTIDRGRARPGDHPMRLPRLFVDRNTDLAALKAFMVPTIGSAYRLANWLIKDVMGRRTWPRSEPRDVQVTSSLPRPSSS